MTVRDVDHGFADLLALGGKRGTVTTGIHAAEGAREHDGSEGVTIADVATFQVFGTETIPPRDFVGGYVDESRAEIESTLRKAARAVVSGKLSLSDALEVVGISLENGMKKKISDGIDPELAESTKAQRKNADGNFTPLIDTGQLWGSITSKVSIK